MTGNERILIAALKAMAAVETRGPSPLLEQKLLQAMRCKRSRWGRPAGLAALAAALTLAAVLRPPSEKLTFPPLLPASPPALLISERKPVPPVPKTVKRLQVARKRRPIQKLVAEREQDPLIRIPYSASLDPTDRAELVRVSMPAAQLLSWGFPISGSDPNFRIDADVLVGGDGLARAVRFIRTGAKK